MTKIDESPLVEGVDVKVDDILEEFLSDYQSPNTKLSYNYIIKDWFEFIRGRTWKWFGDKAILKPKLEDCRKYFAELHERPGIADVFGVKKASYGTLKTKLAILHGFYDNMIDRGYTQGPNPWISIKLKLQEDPKREFRRLSDEQVVLILMQPDRRTIQGRADLAILSLLFGAGMRRSEVASLIIDDIREGGAIRIRRQKNRKVSVLPLPPWASHAVLESLKDRLETDRADITQTLFIKRQGAFCRTAPHMSGRLVANTFATYCRAAGIVGKYTSHCARATAITHLLEQKCDYRTVQEFSRHSSVQMVEVYDKRRFEQSEHPALKIDYAAPNKNR